MNNNFNNTDRMYKTLEFDKVLEMLEELALSENARNRCRKLEPFLSESDVNRHLKETTEARLVMELMGTPPLSPMTNLDKYLALTGKGAFLSPEDLNSIAQFLTACRRMKSYLKKAESTNTDVALYGGSLYDLSHLEDEINRTIRANRVDDKASLLLSDIRRKIENSGNQIRSKLDSLLRNNKNWFAEGFVTVRNGHYTLPVKREYKNQVSGTVIDISQSGSTYFIEPAAAKRLQDELATLYIEEDNEVRRILFMLTALVEDNLPSIKINADAMETLDFLFAKGKLSMSMKAAPLPVNIERRIEIKGGRHPLLKAEAVVPLDFQLGGETRGIVITGPNTGGKTVALKTVGLLSLMAQSGLHVPAESGCLTMNNYVLCDIGDGQSITENLSTFSSHMTNIIGILKLADDQSLILLDELGSGTDPAEGMGIAVAVLEELAAKKCLFVATTHYPEIKEFAKTSPHLTNARMAFDRKTLLPLYRLEIGEAGESCALYIAQRLGLPQRLIERASKAAYGAGTPAKNAEMAGRSKEITDNLLKVLPDLTRPAHRDMTHDNKIPGDMPSVNTLFKETTRRDMPSDERSSESKRRIKTSEKKNPTSKGYAARVNENGSHSGDNEEAPELPRSMRFNIGDSVIVYPQKLIGIVYRKANDKGEIGVQIQKKKLLVNHKRLKLHVPASELYPDNYDFSIIFDSVATRKAHHVMDRKHDPNLVISLPEE